MRVPDEVRRGGTAPVRAGAVGGQSCPATRSRLQLLQSGFVSSAQGAHQTVAACCRCALQVLDKAKEENFKRDERRLAGGGRGRGARGGGRGGVGRGEGGRGGRGEGGRGGRGEGGRGERGRGRG